MKVNLLKNSNENSKLKKNSKLLNNRKKIKKIYKLLGNRKNTYKFFRLYKYAKSQIKKRQLINLKNFNFDHFKKLSLINF